MHNSTKLRTGSIRPMPSGAGKRQSAECQFSVFVSVSLAFWAYFYSIFLGRYQCCLFQPFTLMMPKHQNRLSIWTRKSSILWSSVAAGGSRNQLSYERFLVFFRTYLVGYVDVVYQVRKYCCPLSAQLPSTQYPRRYQTYLRRAVPTSNGA